MILPYPEILQRYLQSIATTSGWNPNVGIDLSSEKHPLSDTRGFAAIENKRS